MIEEGVYYVLCVDQQCYYQNQEDQGLEEGVEFVVEDQYVVGDDDVDDGQCEGYWVGYGVVQVCQLVFIW